MEFKERNKIPIKSLPDFVKEFQQKNLVEVFNRDGHAEVVKKIAEYIEQYKTEILLAWWAKYGFEPGRAVLVHGIVEGQYVTGVRECTDEEEIRFGLKSKEVS